MLAVQRFEGNMRKKEYIKPLIEEVALDATSVLLTTTEEYPPISDTEGDNEVEDGDGSHDKLLMGNGSGTIFNHSSSPFNR